MNPKVLIGVSGLVIALGLWQVLSSDFVRGSGTVKPGQFRAMNIETGFRTTVDMNRGFTGWPVECPDTGQKTCYPAEVCPNPTCMIDGERTWVVLNSTVGKAGDTKCHQCGTKVGMMNLGLDEPPESATADENKAPRKRGRRGRRTRGSG